MHESLTIERVVRYGLIVESDEGFALKAGDIVGVYALREAVGPLSQWVGRRLIMPNRCRFRPARSISS